eukprot:334566-Pyramimonas_sp.AAC.1
MQHLDCRTISPAARNNGVLKQARSWHQPREHREQATGLSQTSLTRNGTRGERGRSGWKGTG